VYVRKGGRLPGGEFADGHCWPAAVLVVHIAVSAAAPLRLSRRSFQLFWNELWCPPDGADKPSYFLGVLASSKAPYFGISLRGWP
jgi:hypothetical protein